MRNVISADYARIGRRGGLASKAAKRVVARGNVLKRWRRKPDAGILPLHRLRDGILYLDHVQDLKQGVLSIMQDRRADTFKNGHCTPEPT